MIKCPNINHSDWKAIEAKYGEDTAWAAYRLWGEEIPSLAEVDNYIKMYAEDSDITEPIVFRGGGVSEVFNSSEELKKVGTEEEYLEYLSTVFPNSQVEDVVYHHSSQRLDRFNNNYLGTQTKAPDTQLGFFFAEDKNDIPNMVDRKNKQLEEIRDKLKVMVSNNENKTKQLIRNQDNNKITILMFIVVIVLLIANLVSNLFKWII